MGFQEREALLWGHFIRVLSTLTPEWHEGSEKDGRWIVHKIGELGMKTCLTQVPEITEFIAEWAHCCQIVEWVADVITVGETDRKWDLAINVQNNSSIHIFYGFHMCRSTNFNL